MRGIIGIIVELPIQIIITTIKSKQTGKINVDVLKKSLWSPKNMRRIITIIILNLLREVASGRARARARVRVLNRSGRVGRQRDDAPIVAIRHLTLKICARFYLLQTFQIRRLFEDKIHCFSLYNTVNRLIEQKREL
jgi:hypothetical protein